MRPLKVCENINPNSKALVQKHKKKIMETMISSLTQSLTFAMHLYTYNYICTYTYIHTSSYISNVINVMSYCGFGLGRSALGSPQCKVNVPQTQCPHDSNTHI